MSNINSTSPEEFIKQIPSIQNLISTYQDSEDYNPDNETLLNNCLYELKEQQEMAIVGSSIDHNRDF